MFRGTWPQAHRELLNLKTLHTCDFGKDKRSNKSILEELDVDENLVPQLHQHKNVDLPLS